MMQPPEATIETPIIRAGGLAVTSWLPEIGGIEPIGLNRQINGGAKPFVTQCCVEYRYGSHSIIIPPRFAFDGASIPRMVWWIKGFSPLDRSVWAALPHDWICEHPQELPRNVGDMIFLDVLRAVGVPEWRASLMYAGVRGYSRLKGLG